MTALALTSRSDPAPREENRQRRNDCVDGQQHLVERRHRGLEPIDQRCDANCDDPGNDQRRETTTEKRPPRLGLRRLLCCHFINCSAGCCHREINRRRNIPPAIFYSINRASVSRRCQLLRISLTSRRRSRLSSERSRWSRRKSRLSLLSSPRSPVLTSCRISRLSLRTSRRSVRISRVSSRMSRQSVLDPPLSLHERTGVRTTPAICAEAAPPPKVIVRASAAVSAVIFVIGGFSDVILFQSRGVAQLQLGRRRQSNRVNRDYRISAKRRSAAPVTL